MSKILVTGATGFVGKQLILSLLERGHEVYAICRIRGTRVFSDDKPNLFYIWGDLRNPDTYREIPQGIDAAYYLVHSMSGIVANLSDTEEQVARAFVNGIKETGVRQIIYLGGIINDERALSPHLKSRLLVETILNESKIPTTILRASLIIGAGSASFEIIRDLCAKLPWMVVPKWVKTPCQPIGVQDVLFYLTGVLLNEACYNKTFDIGGPEVLNFKQLMQNYAAVGGGKIRMLEVPFLSPRLSSYWLFFVTSVRFSLCYYLVESMKSSTVVRLDEIQSILPHTCLTYRESIISAMEQTSSHQLVSTWMDAWDTEDENPDIAHYIETAKNGGLKDERRVPIKASRDIVIDRIWRIGGETGYYVFDWAWYLRGILDKMAGGIGLNRGRRDPAEIHVGDSIDFWRVLVADKKKGCLLLLSNMKVPGKAWLSFQLVENGTGTYLVQTALFQPSGILGYLYWYSLYPIHCFLFQKMAKAIGKA
ncbi:NAD-dependent epimerase/dehydratase [Estrella lausannensis]|uniref:NAD-dependent epimerase/dehydratase n=2 Tax=Estrella lausannensis TaxID=483423 RepID=A0A0H5E329_9BACT|nr:NAD-dependent epimerase/dehydratase [Estrella lausannensis]